MICTRENTVWGCVCVWIIKTKLSVNLFQMCHHRFYPINKIIPSLPPLHGFIFIIISYHLIKSYSPPCLNLHHYHLLLNKLISPSMFFPPSLIIIIWKINLLPPCLYLHHNYLLFNKSIFPSITLFLSLTVII